MLGAIDADWDLDHWKWWEYEDDLDPRLMDVDVDLGGETESFIDVF